MQERRSDEDVFTLLPEDLKEQQRLIEEAIGNPRNESVTIHKTEAVFQEAKQQAATRRALRSRKAKRKRQRASRRANRR